MPVSAARRTPIRLGPYSAGLRMTPQQFDQAEFEEGWRYELINGVLVVSPIPSEEERSANDELGHLLLNYRQAHPKGKVLNATLFEHVFDTGRNRRRADRVIWCGLGRKPRKGETPTIVVEFVSAGRGNWLRDYEQKRDEYLAAGVKEYWVIDRFDRELVVFSRQGKRTRKRTVKEKQVYTTPLLPGFELPLARLLAVADEWEESGS